MVSVIVQTRSDLLLSRIGDFVERITPKSIHESVVQDLGMEKMIKNLEFEWIKG